ncbi:TRAP transporter substrate-binding protein [[Mannheimia] succiniciproducens]|uniref:DctP protein n=1 Tax=Mannheimia succiniciproducens (strain KCTC 0769BP / MBEL55E) TaxID=221988 RepID=Q65UQ5_MANSM|nr:TRAP transporter substrate-binding protein [[Mannheimia] succiniciproducens]AAU37305.1 DctP protein [[Mannheimia] succiniciproducens MBEL55E]
MKLKTFILSSLSIVLPLCAVSTNAIAAKVTLKLAHNLEQSHVIHKALDYMAKEVKEKSNGELILRIYPNRQMGDARETIELLQNDALDMTKANSSELEPFVKEMAVFTCPYLFNNDEHFKKVLYGSAGKSITDKTKNSGFTVLSSYVGGSRNFYTKKPIYSPADLKGMKIRVISTPTTNRIIELLGGSPVPVPLGEVYTALQQGVIDGAENNIPSYTSTRHVEVAKYFTEDQHTSMPDYLVIANKVWNKLDENQQKILLDAAKESEIYQQKLWDEETIHSRREAEKIGTTFIQVDKQPFRDALIPLYNDFKQNPVFSQIIADIEAEAK